MSAELRMNGDYPVFEHRLFDPGHPALLPALQEVAHAYGLHIPPGAVVEVRLYFHDGRSLSLTMTDKPEATAPAASAPAASAPAASAPAASASEPQATSRPPKPGWEVSGNVAMFNGVPLDGREPFGVTLTGRKLDALRPLVEASGPIKIADLRRAFQASDLNTGKVKAGQDYDYDDGSIRWTIGDLRRTLQKAFPSFEGKHVENIPGAGYTLMIR